MILILLSWGWIGISSFLLGFTVMHGIGKVTGKDKPESLELYILMGLLCLTVYAQIFSLIGGVGGKAMISVGILCMVLAVIFMKRIIHYVRYLYSCICIKYWFLLFFIIFLVTIYITAGQARNYDTDLYHAQAIRWIEQYGVVKGLGNLHNRFAYNSAFFCLQALFSMKFITNQSMHSMNGFVTFLMLSYAISTLNIWKKERLKTSDFFKIGIFIYFGFWENVLVISSPGSDTLTMCMVLYISAKWAELAEQEEKSPDRYGILCLLATWAVTIKLSAGLLVLLAAYPAVLLVRQKKWKQIIMFVVLGLLIIMPFLIRNVLVSGYLIYPYSSIDLFNVDWKMAASVAADDSREIMAWGRGMTSRELYDASFSIWFPRWFGNQQGMIKMLFIANIVCFVLLTGYSVWTLLRKHRDYDALMLLLLVSAGQVLAWFLTAPLARYGLAYMLLLPAYLMGLVWRQIDSRIFAWAVCSVAVCFGGFRMLQFAGDYTECSWKCPADYNWREAESITWENMEVYVPVGSDCIGYHYFPSTPNRERLEAIELRTGNLADGFRLKADYREKEFNSAGVVVE